MRRNAVHELPPQPLRGDLRHFDLRVREQQAEQLPAGIPGSADDRRLHRASWRRALARTSTPRSNSPPPRWGGGVGGGAEYSAACSCTLRTNAIAPSAALSFGPAPCPIGWV